MSGTESSSPSSVTIVSSTAPRPHRRAGQIQISWGAVECITQGRLGRIMTTCPLCSSLRSTVQKRSAKVLAIYLIEPEFAVYFCNHCQTQGYSRPDTPSRIIDLAEQQRQREQAKRFAETEKQNRTRQALALWNEAGSFRGSRAEDYLHHTRSIGDWLDKLPFLDKVFRYHPACPFGPERLPCMLALVREIKTNAPVAIHRTALTTDNPPQRIERKSFGPTTGGAIKISPDHEVHTGLLIGEGPETVLSASQQFQFRPVWSVIDKNGIAKFPILPGIECLTVAVDNDASGDGQRAAAECVRRQTQAGVECITVKPNLVKDFNDIARQHSTGQNNA
jgi:Toprim domain